MKIGARDQLPGTITRVTLGSVMAEIVVDIGGHEVVSAITKTSAESLELKTGDSVTVIVKSTEVMIGKQSSLEVFPAATFRS